MDKKKVLVLGGAGFIGYGIVKYLVENRDYRITVGDDFSASGHDDEFLDYCSDNNIRVIDNDFTNPTTYSKLDSDYEYLYMLASIVGVNRCIEEPEEVIRINANLILNTLEWAKSGSVQKALFASSSENYAATTDLFDYVIPTPETVPVCIEDTRHPRFSYAVTKIFGESAFFAYAKKYGFTTTIVRYQNVYGPRMGFKHAIPHIIERFVRDKKSPFSIYGGNQTRAFTFITDAAECSVLALERQDLEQEIFHVGNSTEISIQHLTKLIGSHFEYDGPYRLDPTYPGSVNRRCPDLSKTETILGYSPKVSLQDGLVSTINWYRDYFHSGKSITTGGFRPPESLRDFNELSKQT